MSGINIYYYELAVEAEKDVTKNAMKTLCRLTTDPKEGYKNVQKHHIYLSFYITYPVCVQFPQ